MSDETQSEFLGVVFDLDGVITDTAELHYQAWAALAAELECPFDEAFNAKLKGVSRMESLDLILQHGGKELSEEDKLAYATKKNDHYRSLLDGLGKKDILPGIVTLLEELRSKKIGIALGSASKNATLVLERLGLVEHFDYIVDAAKVSRGKPDPETFLVGAKGLGLSPSDCVGVEDAPAGVEAVLAAGMKCIGVGTDAGIEKADQVVTSTAELSLNMFESLF